MVWSSHSVVAISINGLHHGRSLHHGSMNNQELSLAIYVSMKILYLELYYQ